MIQHYKPGCCRKKNKKGIAIFKVMVTGLIGSEYVCLLFLLLLLSELDSLDTKPCFYKYPCEKIALLCLGSWSQQQFRNLLNVCPDHNYLLQCVTFYSQTLFGDASS